MVIMDMENGDQVTKPGCLCPKDSRGGVNNPNNPPYLRHWFEFKTNTAASDVI